MDNTAVEDNELSQNIKYNRLTGLKLFAMTSSMVISVSELVPFGKTGPTAIFYLLLAGLIWFIPITKMAGEMASIDGWNKGGIFTWVKGTLGEKTGWTALFYQWIHITIGMNVMMYIIIGSVSIILDKPYLNTTPCIRFWLMMIILWSITLVEMVGMKKIGRIAEWCFGLGIAMPVILLILCFFVYLLEGKNVYFHINFDNVFPHKFDGNSLVVFVPFILAFCGGEASAPHVKYLEKPKQYSKVMLGLACVAICFDLLGSMAIGMTVPKELHTNNVTGFVETFGHMLNSINLPGDLLMKIIGALLACGIIGQLGNWLAGPSQGMFEAAKEGYLPAFFTKSTKRDVPMRLIVLQSLIVTLGAIAVTFTSGTNANFAFDVSMAATTVQYLMMYIILLISYIVLKLRHAKLPRTYYMTTSPIKGIGIALVALCITLIAFVLTFIPTRETPEHLRNMYVLIMLIMCAIVTILPLIVYHFRYLYGKKRL
ncbi:amino acid permease [Lactobacillus iners]|uniref:amino acid permease n=1 Tax=Lactobacillus iners TaxID=147802 RepID=UPI003EBB16C5